MFKYVSDISEISHFIIDKYISNKEIAVDATLGNGYDCDFLISKFNKVYAFDIQKEACLKYREKNISNVIIIEDSHEKFSKYIDTKVDCIVYNLGFLPGGNKSITTKKESTLNSIKVGLNILRSGGMMLIAIYRGHNEGKAEESVIMDFVSNLDKGIYGVISHKFENRSKEAPILIVVEKK